MILSKNSRPACVLIFTAFMACDPFAFKHACFVDADCLNGRVCLENGLCGLARDAGADDSRTDDVVLEDIHPDASVDAASDDIVIADSATEDRHSRDARVMDLISVDHDEMPDAAADDVNSRQDAVIDAVSDDAATTNNGDNCSEAIAIGLGSDANGGTVQLSGTLLGMDDDYESTLCNVSYRDYPDGVYRFTTAHTFDLLARVTPMDESWSPLLMLRQDCSAADSACSSSTPTAEVRLSRITPGTYFLIVDASEGMVNSGYNLSVSLAPPVTGDICADPLPLVLPSPDQGGVQVHADLRDMHSHYETSYCSSGLESGYADAVFALELGAARDVSITVTRDSGTWQPIVMLRQDCSSFDITCGTNPSGSVSLPRSRREAGLYYVIVDAGAGPITSGFQLEVIVEDLEATPKRVFTSSEFYNGNLRSYYPTAVGVEAADHLCNDLAIDAGLGAEFVAIIRDSSRSLEDRMPTTGPWYLTDGRLAFVTMLDIVIGVPRTPLDVDETGVRPGGVANVWTGTRWGDSAGSNCDNWEYGGFGTLGVSGLFNSSDAAWIDADYPQAYASSCDSYLHLYCIEQ